jgi:hypothetical protein
MEDFDGDSSSPAPDRETEILLGDMNLSMGKRPGMKTKWPKVDPKTITDEDRLLVAPSE